MHWWRALLIIAVACTPPLAWGADCREQLLRELGWTLHETARDAPWIAGGQPCRRSDLADARAHGDLQAWLPRERAAHAQALDAVLQHEATRCAYMYRLGDAAQAATGYLQSNAGYRFSALQAGWVSFGAGGARAQGWRSTRLFARALEPSGSNSEAVDAFYSGRVRSECGVGRQIAQLATQRELYGDAAFDTEFAPGELTIGTFMALHDSDSILLGRNAGTLHGDGLAVRASALGRQAFAGVPGFIVPVLGVPFIDDGANQAENFIIVRVDAEAAEALQRHGGLAWYNARNAAVQALATQLAGDGRRRFERLLLEREPELRSTLSPAQQRVLSQLDDLLDDPFYRGVHLYVHPLGTRTVGDHIVRLIDRNPRTPFAVELARHNLHDGLFRRWMAARLQACAAATHAALPADATPRLPGRRHP